MLYRSYDKTNTDSWVFSYCQMSYGFNIPSSPTISLLKFGTPSCGLLVLASIYVIIPGTLSFFFFHIIRHL